MSSLCAWVLIKAKHWRGCDWFSPRHGYIGIKHKYYSQEQKKNSVIQCNNNHRCYVNGEQNSYMRGYYNALVKVSTKIKQQTQTILIDPCPFIFLSLSLMVQTSALRGSDSDQSPVGSKLSHSVKTLLFAAV